MKHVRCERAWPSDADDVLYEWARLGFELPIPHPRMVDINRRELHAEFFPNLSPQCIENRFWTIDSTTRNVPPSLRVLNAKQAIIPYHKCFHRHDILTSNFDCNRRRHRVKTLSTLSVDSSRIIAGIDTKGGVHESLLCA